jgi:hypothetical protein
MKKIEKSIPVSRVQELIKEAVANREKEIVEIVEERKNYNESQRIIFRDNKEVSIELRSRVEILKEVLDLITKDK